MERFKSKIIASFLTGTMVLGTVTGVTVEVDSIKSVSAETRALSDAKAKINHLVSSMKNNYLGIKNQATFEIYIKEAEILISKIGRSEKSQKTELENKLSECKAIVKILASINQVEKSILPVEQGGYGNFHGIKNAETWRIYLNNADSYFKEAALFSNGDFKKQYDELKERRELVEVVVKGIEDDFEKEYKIVENLFNEAKSLNDRNKARVVLLEAEKLGTCRKSDSLEFNIKRFIEGKSEITFKKYTDATYKYNIEYPSNFEESIYETDEWSVAEFKLNKNSETGIVVLTAIAKDGVGYGADEYYNESTKKDLENNKGVTIISEEVEKEYFNVEFLLNGERGNMRGYFSNGVLHMLTTSYPENEKNEYKEIMDYIVNSFTNRNINPLR